MDFVYLIRVLLHRKWIILGSAVLAALIAWFLTGTNLNIIAPQHEFQPDLQYLINKGK